MKEKIGIIGLGYVGLPLAHAFAKNDYKIVGFDINKSRVLELQQGFDRTLEIDVAQLKEIKEHIVYTSASDDLIDCSIFIITVPTPIDKNNRPDLTPLINSSQLIGSVLKKDDIVIYESTVYPGVTEAI